MTVSDRPGAIHSDTEGLVHAVLIGNSTAYAVGGFAALKVCLNERQERFIKIAAFDPPYEGVLDLPLWLERALEGHMRYRFVSDPFIWEYINTFDASDWEIAERVNESLRVVKQARRVKTGLIQKKLEAPASWQAALKLAASHAPEVFTRSLATPLESDA